MVKRSDLLACSIHNWYPNFLDVTFKTAIVPLPDPVVKWLEEDGIVLPYSSAAFPTRSRQETILAEDDYQDWSSDDEDADPNSDTQSQSLPAAVTAFSESLNDAIEKLGGAVFPKLTWSCPKDAAWVSVGNTLQCSTADEVLLLLKSSDRVMHDISSALLECEQGEAEENSMQEGVVDGEEVIIENAADDGMTLRPIPRNAHVVALRKWYDLKPGREFRCFVRNHALIAISQRDVTRRYPELEDEAVSIQDRIEDFHDASIAHRFPLRTYTFDVYVPTSPSASLKLIDFNPSGGTTAPLLFDWEELEVEGGVDLRGKEGKKEENSAEKKEGNSATEEEFRIMAQGNRTPQEEELVEFRIIREDVAMRPDTAVYGVPYDFVDGSDGSALSSLLEQAKKQGAEEVLEALQMAGTAGRPDVDAGAAS